MAYSFGKSARFEWDERAACYPGTTWHDKSVSLPFPHMTNFEFCVVNFHFEWGKLVAWVAWGGPLHLIESQCTRNITGGSEHVVVHHSVLDFVEPVTHCFALSPVEIDPNFHHLVFHDNCGRLPHSQGLNAPQ